MNIVSCFWTRYIIRNNYWWTFEPSTSPIVLIRSHFDGPTLPLPLSANVSTECPKSNFIEITIRHGWPPLNLLYIFRTLFFLKQLWRVASVGVICNENVLPFWDIDKMHHHIYSHITYKTRHSYTPILFC